MNDAEVLVRTSEADSEDKELTARCPDGKLAIGGGAQVLGATTSSLADIPAGVAIVATHPLGGTGSPTPEWKAAAKEIVAVTADWRLSVNVVCATIEEK